MCMHTTLLLNHFQVCTPMARTHQHSVLTTVHGMLSIMKKGNVRCQSFLDLEHNPDHQRWITTSLIDLMGLLFYIICNGLLKYICRFLGTYIHTYIRMHRILYITQCRIVNSIHTQLHSKTIDKQKVMDNEPKLFMLWVEKL